MLPTVNEMWNSFNDNLAADLLSVPTLRHCVPSELVAQCVHHCAGWLHRKHPPRSANKQSSNLGYNHSVELFSVFNSTKYEIGHDITVRNKRVISEFRENLPCS